MSRYASSCKWCGDRPGGCLYCLEQLENLPEDKLFALNEMIEAGEIHVVAVRTNREILVRQLNRGNNRARAIAAPARRCTNHLWAHDGVMFKQRHCTRPGCGARQKFVWLPDSADTCGKWVDVTEPINAKPQRTPKPAKKIVRKKKVKQVA